MTGWLLKDKQHAGEPANVYKFPKFRLGPGKSVRVHTGKGKNGATNLYMGLTSYVWSDSGDTAILEKKSGHVVSTCGWTSTDSSPKFC